MNTKRMVGLDIFRITCALFVCLFHITIKLNTNFGIMQPFISMGAIFMTAFFMMSGFILYTIYSNKNLLEQGNFKKYFIKRILSIIPMYYIIMIIFYIFYWNSEYDLTLLPIELACLQSIFPNIFYLNHNGGTWFISCIMFCYLVFPYIQSIFLSIKDKTRIILLLAIALILIYVPHVNFRLNMVQIYTNPFFRILEFFIGAGLASLKPRINSSKFIKKIIYNWLSIFVSFIGLIIFVSIAVKHNFHFKDYLYYNIFCIPFFSIIIIGLSEIKNKKIEKSKVIKYLSDISYCVFLSQIFSNNISKIIIQKYNITGNLCIIGVGLASCIIISLLLYEIFDRNIKRIIKKKINM